jgi:hypothetical protein
VRFYDDLYKILDGFEPGEEVVVRVLRDREEELEFDLRLVDVNARR